MNKLYQTIKPYGSLNSKLVVAITKYKEKYFVKDISANTYEISKEVYEEIKHDRN